MEKIQFSFIVDTCALQIASYIFK